MTSTLPLSSDGSAVADHRIVTPENVTIRVVRDLGDHRAAWDALVDAAPLPSPFLKSWWLDAVGCPGAVPHYVLVLEGTRLLGGMALQRRRLAPLPWYEVLGGGRLCPDHLDLVAADADAERVGAALRSWMARPCNRGLDLDGVAGGARLLSSLHTLSGVTVTRSATAPFEPLPGATGETGDDAVAGYYAARSKTFTKRIRSRRRRVERAGTTLRRVPPGEMPRALEGLRALHSTRPDRAPLLRHFDRLHRGFVAGACAGEAHAWIAERDDEICGVLISMTTGAKLATYQIARRTDADHSDVGTVLYAAAIEEACASGARELDLLRGEENYKTSFVGHQRALLRVRYAHGLPGRGALGCLRVLTVLRTRGQDLRTRWQGLWTRPTARSDHDGGARD